MLKAMKRLVLSAGVAEACVAPRIYPVKFLSVRPARTAAAFAANDTVNGTLSEIAIVSAPS